MNAGRIVRARRLRAAGTKRKGRGYPIDQNLKRNDRIRVNGLNIGWTDTPNEHVVQTNVMGCGEDWLAAAERQQPFGQLIKPNEVAAFVVFLLSTASGIMTGSVIDYDQNVIGAYD